MQFQWTQFAYLYDVTVTKTCTYIRDDLLQVISSPLVNVDMNYYKEFNFNDSESVNKTIGTLSDNARGEWKTREQQRINNYFIIYFSGCSLRG